MKCGSIARPVKNEFDGGYEICDYDNLHDALRRSDNLFEEILFAQKSRLLEALQNLSTFKKKIYRFMRVTFHDFETKNAIDGALYNYSEVAKILSQNIIGGIQPQPHDFFTLLNSKEHEQLKFVRSLSANDIVFSNVGPLCFFYFYLREKFNGNFRILRDVRTSSWAPYWLQEYIAGPLTRTGDVVIFPSDFCRQYYLHLFQKWLFPDNTVVFYPLTFSFPEIVQKKRKNHLRIGYLGRMSSDKNVEQILSVYTNLVKHEDKNAELHLAGASGNKYSPENIKKYFKKNGVSDSKIFHYGRLPYENIWKVYDNIDVLLFPTMASVESLGRIIIEASRAQVPVVTAHYAAGPELIPKENLIKTYYNLSKQFDSRVTCSLGLIDEIDAVKTILNAKSENYISKMPRYQVASFRNLLFNEFDSHVNENLNPVIKSFIRSIKISRAKELDRDAAMRICLRLQSYNQNRSIMSPHIRLENVYSFWSKYLTSSISEKKYQLHRLQLKRKSREKTMLDLSIDFCEYIDFSPFFSLIPDTEDKEKLFPISK